jgi:hypothetical protein
MPKSILNTGISPRPATKLNAAHTSHAGLKTLADLPAEMLLDITEYLPTSSAAALTICSRICLQKIGTRHLEEINKGTTDPWFFSTDTPPPLTPQQAERDTFLAFLDRDLIDQIYCYYCKKIHDPKKTRSEYSHMEREKESLQRR